MLLETAREFLEAPFSQEYRAYPAGAGFPGLQGRVDSWACPGVTLATPVANSIICCSVENWGKDENWGGCEPEGCQCSLGSNFPNACSAHLHGSGHSRDDCSRKVCPACSPRSGGRSWSLNLDTRRGDGLPLLGCPCVARSFHPTEGNKATHEGRSFNEVIFVNHSTSQTWSLPENEQFCIKRSIGVNGEGQTPFAPL